MTLVSFQLDMVKKHQQPPYAGIFSLSVVTSPLILMSGLLSVEDLAFLLLPRRLWRTLQLIRVLHLTLKLSLGHNLPQCTLLILLQSLLLLQIRYKHFILFF